MKKRMILSLCTLALLKASCNGRIFTPPNLNAPQKQVSKPLNEQLLSATYKGDTALMKQLIEKGADVNARKKEGEQRPPLHAAAEHGKADAVRLLLQHGAQADTKDTQNVTALHLAADEGHVDIIHALVDAGADVNVTTEEGRTPIDRAMVYGKGESVKALIEKGASHTLIAAAMTGDTQLVANRLKAGDKASMTSSPGWTPLSIAAAYGHEAVVNQLLKAGADVNQVFEQYTPLIAAINGGNVSIIKAFLDAGANVNVNHPWHGTPMHMAATKGHVKIMELLLAEGADINALNSQKETPLRRAIDVAGMNKEHPSYPKVMKGIAFLKSKGARIK